METSERGQIIVQVLLYGVWNARYKFLQQINCNYTKWNENKSPKKYWSKQLLLFFSAWLCNLLASIH